MGICKCRKRTDLFCFVHKKAVCETCICSDHQVCVVKSYFDWLSEPEYETPVCGICKGELNQDNLVRFLCLDMFHPECIDVYASSLPVTTAQAGYTCPTCDKPMLPTSSNTSPLAVQIRKSFATSSWAIRVLGTSEPTSSPDLPSNDKQPLLEEKLSDSTKYPIPTPTETSFTPKPEPTYKEETPTGLHPLDPLSYHPPATPYNPNTTINIDNQLSNSSSSIYGSTSHRKAQKPMSNSSYRDEEEEDKYKRKGVMQAVAALGLASSDTRKMTVAFAVVAMVVILIFLYYVMSSEPTSVTTEIVE